VANVQECECTGKDDWVVPYWAKVTSVRPGNQRPLQALHTAASHGHRGCPPTRGWDPHQCLFRCEEIKDDGTETQKTFFHVPSAIEAEEAEEIGVEHLLRDIKDSTTTTLTTRVAEQLSSLRGLQSRLSEVRDYLKNVANGSLPISHQVVYHLQDAFNLLPNLDDAALTRAFTTNTNDQLLVVYLSALIRAVIALEKLVENKATNGVAELEEGIAKGGTKGKALTNGTVAPSVTEKKDDAGETGDRKSAEK